MTHRLLMAAGLCLLHTALFAGFYDQSSCVQPTAPTQQAIQQSQKKKKRVKQKNTSQEMARKLMKDNARDVCEALQGPWQGRRNTLLKEIMARSTTNRNVIMFLTSSKRGPGAQRLLDAILAQSVNPPLTTCTTDRAKFSYSHAVALRGLCVEGKAAVTLPSIAWTADADSNQALNVLFRQPPAEQQLIWDLLKQSYITSKKAERHQTALNDYYESAVRTQIIPQ